jgi:DNA (cytosine-5)-methyltransferase 1
MRAYYNEHDSGAAKWLRNLIAAGLIAPGDVDERSIEDVLPSDLAGYGQCHFFAGIAGWSLALRLADWPDDRPVWSGSAPCQPFSAAGKGAGADDERHLWPAFHHLIAQCRPPVVFGEQVEAAIRHGWSDLVQADLEGIGYAYGDAGLPAACVSAPHIRQRIFFVAESNRLARGQGGSLDGRRDHGSDAQPRTGFGGGCMPECVADIQQHSSGCPANDSDHRQSEADSHEDRADAVGERRDGRRALLRSVGSGRIGTAAALETAWGGEVGRTDALDGFWRDADWLYCQDDKWRPVEPGLEPLVDGIPASLGRGKSTLGGMAKSNRVIRLRGYGNAIVPELAAAFIHAYLGGE